jgi:hypothetical protein
MISYKEEVLELYRIKKALSPLGYAVCSVRRTLGRGVGIEAALCLPGEHDEYIRKEEELLLSLPDDINLHDHGKARQAAYKANRQSEEL